MVTIFLDADSLPILVRSLVERRALSSYEKALAKSEEPFLSVHFTANRIIKTAQSPVVLFTLASSDSQAADDFIVNSVKEHDLVITRDILLAERLVQKKIAVMNHFGEAFTENTIRERVSLRNASLELKTMNIAVERSTSYGEKDAKKFVNGFDSILTKLLKLDQKS